MSAAIHQVMASRRKLPKQRRKKRLSSKERAVRSRDRRFRTDINTIFTNAGFTQIATRDRQLNIAGRQGEIDSFFVYRNVLVLVEDTTTKDVKEHLLKSADFFKHIAGNTAETLRVLASKFPKFRAIRSGGEYGDDEYRWVFVYCSLNQLRQIV